MAYHRPPMPNSDSRLIKALLSTIQSHIDGDYSDYQPQLETLMSWKLLQVQVRFWKQKKDIQMPDFVRKLIDKKGRENVKMPYLIKKNARKEVWEKNMIK